MGLTIFDGKCDRCKKDLPNELFVVSQNDKNKEYIIICENVLIERVCADCAPTVREEISGFKSEGSLIFDYGEEMNFSVKSGAPDENDE